VGSKTNEDELRPKPSARVAAIVDRTANVGDAALTIGSSRVAYGGRSPYAPDIVLVNEFVADDFLFHLVQAVTSYEGNASTSQHPSKAHLQTVKEFENDAGVKVVMSAANGSIVEIKDR